MPKRSKVIIEGKRTYYIYVFVGWEVHVVKNCHRGLENAYRGCRPRAAFLSPRSWFFTIETDPKQVNNFLPSL